MDYYIVEAFTDKAFGGNTAGVVLYENLTKDVMQKIAAELRFSETVFVNVLQNNLFSLKYFTPNSELDLCGHATVAAFKVLSMNGYVAKKNICNIQTNAGLLSVFIENNKVFMESGQAIEGMILDEISTDKLSCCLNIDKELFGDPNNELCPQIISTGLYDIILPVKNTFALNSINPDFKALSELSRELCVVGVHAFTLSSAYTAECRNFAPLYGIDEEAATGTSNASLAYYLYKYNVLNQMDKDYTFIQGVTMQRPSEIIIRLLQKDNLNILIGGTAYILATGKFIL